MAWHKVVASIILGGSIGGCYVETIDGERDSSTARRIKQDGRPEATAIDAEAGQCRVTAQKGCFDGHVIAKKEFLVEGKTFFNADDLATRFGELITVEQLGGSPVAAEDYRVSLITAMDNFSFFHGFEYYLSGATIRSGNVRNNGVFNISELAEGSYELRLQKAIQFEVQQKSASPVPQTPSTPSPAPLPNTLPERPTDQPNGSGDEAANFAPSTAGDTISVAADVSTAETTTVPALALNGLQEGKAKIYCATIYVDKTIDVRRGQRLWEPFNEFRLHVIDRECPQAGSGRVVTL